MLGKELKVLPQKQLLYSKLKTGYKSHQMFLYCGCGKKYLLSNVNFTLIVICPVVLRKHLRTRHLRLLAHGKKMDRKRKRRGVEHTVWIVSASNVFLYINHELREKHKGLIYMHVKNILSRVLKFRRFK